MKHRQGESFAEVSSADFLPGDVVALPHDLDAQGFQVPCDLALITGSAVVDEASLTGESLPVMKVTPPLLPRPDPPQLPPEQDAHTRYQAERDKKCTIYSGTRILTTSGDQGKVLALVVRTGFNTGQLLDTFHLTHDLTHDMT